MGYLYLVTYLPSSMMRVDPTYYSIDINRVGFALSILWVPQGSCPVVRDRSPPSLGPIHFFFNRHIFVFILWSLVLVLAVS